MPDKEKTDPPPHPNQRVPLAYENKKFLNGPDGRILRILAEYQEPLSKFRRERIQDTIVFFGSARFHSQEQAQAALQDLQKAKDPPYASLPRSEERWIRSKARSNPSSLLWIEDERPRGRKEPSDEDYRMRFSSQLAASGVVGHRDRETGEASW